MRYQSGEFELFQLYNNGSAWITLVLLGGLILLFMFRPERVHRPGLMTAGCWLFALSILIPMLVSFLLYMFVFVVQDDTSWDGYKFLIEIRIILNTLKELLLGMSILCVLLAMTPDSRRKDPPQPVRHPLE